MKNRPIALIVPLIVLILGLVAGCGDPTPTNTPEPTTPTPPPTNTPEPTPTDIPPTPTATLTPQQAIDRAQPAVVQLRSGNVIWNGVMVGDGLILTSSRSLAQAPVADYQTRSGEQGQAWVVGRDDDYDLALLEIVNPSGSYPSLDVVPLEAPGIDESFIAVEFNGTQNARVLGVRNDPSSGIRYIQILASAGTQSNGALVIDQLGRVRGLRVSEEHMREKGLGVQGEVYAVSSEALANIILPRLESGVVIARAPGSGSGDGATPTVPPNPPPLPAVFFGDITFQGAPLPVDERVYVRLSRSGRPDLWFSHRVTNAGRYNVAISPLQGGYEGGTIEFWVNAVKAAQTATFEAADQGDLSLTFE